MLCILSSLSVSSLCKFYNRANVLYEATHRTRCNTQYALRPCIDSEMNHIRLFIKIPYIIDLPSIITDTINTLKKKIAITEPFGSTSIDEKSIFDKYSRHVAIEFTANVKETQDKPPTSYWIPKRHKI